MHVCSRPSDQHPDRNEDAYVLAAEHGVAAVLDGIGGHHGGHEASHVAAQALAQMIDSQPVTRTWATSAAWHARRVLLAARVYMGLPDMGTTLTLAVRHDNELTIFHVGDSRAWWWDGCTLTCLTADHGPLHNQRRQAVVDARDQMRMQAMLDEIDVPTQLPEALLPAYLCRNRLYSELGAQKTDFELYRIPLDTPGWLLLTSDGIHDNLRTSEMEEILAGSLDAEALVDAASKRAASDHPRAKPDDMTAVLLQCEE